MGEPVASGEYALEAGRSEHFVDAVASHVAASVLVILTAADDVDRAAIRPLDERLEFGAGADQPNAGVEVPQLAL